MTRKTLIYDRQLLEAYEDLDNELVLKFIKAYDNIFEVVIT